MIQTNTAYMSDPARAERVVRRVMNLTLREMGTNQAQNFIDHMTDKFCSVEELSPEKFQNVPYIELVCLIHNVKDQSEYNGWSYDSQALQLEFYQSLAVILRNGSLCSIPIRLFMALPLKAFYTALSRLSANDRMMRQYKRIQHLCSYKDGYTIEDFLNEKLQKLNNAWRPTMSPDYYQDMITGSLSDIGALLVESFQKAFPRQFFAEEICCKYSAYEAVQPISHSAGDDEKLPM